MKLYSVYNITKSANLPGAWQKQDAEIAKAKFEQSKPKNQYKLIKWKPRNE